MLAGDNSAVVPAEGSNVADEAKLICIIRDMTNPLTTTKFTITLSVSTKASTLVEEVARQLGYVVNTFNLVYDKQQEEGPDEEVVLNDINNVAIGNICDQMTRRHNFCVYERNGTKPEKFSVEETCDAVSQGVDALSLGASASSAAALPSSGVDNRYNNTSTIDYSSCSPLQRSDTGYVGLVNQAMTCYLNSLLQTLYMTPEFRNAIYRWEFDGSAKEKITSIPYQLQKLFVLMQTSKKRAVETTDLTRSFGWDSSEAWQQHDVQELCRVMFDALEQKWRNTDQAELINRLYQGSMKDYVKCLQCGHESARTDAFLDIPLVIRPFGSVTAYASVEEALSAFVQPETLDGNNQYFCEKCNKKCNAHKGFKFCSFPYLLTLQLKRFDFDYNTMHRIKLNDRMTFPQILNLNHLVEDGGGGGGVAPDNKDLHNNADTVDNKVNYPISNEKVHTNHTDSDEGIDEGIDLTISATSSQSDFSVGGVGAGDASSNNFKNSLEMSNQGPYVYELFSIMIHSGSAAGGHYYAYIKSFKEGQWYSFNDQHVSTITFDDIRKVFGGSSSNRGYYSSAYMSSTNAYMLMYRRIEQKSNKDFMMLDEFPQHLKQELQYLRDQEEADRKQREIDISTCKIKLFCNHPVQKKMMEMKFEVHKDKTLKEATQQAWEAFQLEELVALECCRLVKYDDFHDSAERSYEGEDATSMSALLGGVRSTYMFDLLLETRRRDQAFQQYKPGGVSVKVFLVDIATEKIQPPVTVRAYLTQTISEFKSLVSTVLGLPADIRCVLERYCNDLRLMTVTNKTLKAEGFFRSNKVFVEHGGPEEDYHVPFIETRLYKLLDCYENTIRLYVGLPPQEKHDILDECSTDAKSINQSQTEVPNSSCPGNDDEGISDEIDSSSNEKRTVETAGGLIVRHVTTTTEAASSTDIHSVISETIHRQHMAQLSHGQEGAAQGGSHHASGGGAGNTDVTADVAGLSCDATEQPIPSSTSPPSVSSATVSLESLSSRTLSPSSTQSSQDSSQSLSTGGASSSGGNVSNSPSPEENAKEFTVVAKETSENWDLDDPPSYEADMEDKKRYFSANLSPEDEDSQTADRTLVVHVDKRITLGSLKRHLESYVGTTSENFKIFRVYANSQEFETTRLTDNLVSFGDDSRLNVKLGRALKKGEYRVKVYQLMLHDPEGSRFLIDTVFAKGMTVLQSKQLILSEVKRQCHMDIPLTRCRLRRKTWRNPGTIYIDTQVYDDDIPIFANWEIFLEELSDEEVLTSISQIALFVRRWSPSQYALGPFQEIVLDQSTVLELKEKLSAVSGIHVDDVEFAKGRGTFPCEVSLLEIHKDLDWNPHVTALNMWPLYICDDGSVLYYRDKGEELAPLSKEKQKEIQSMENARLSRMNTGTRINYSPRKERALKIYTDHDLNPAAADLD